MKLYDLVKQGLQDYPELRDNDKKLQWYIWWKCGFVKQTQWGTIISREMFYMAPNGDSITRASRKVREDHPELDSSKEVKAFKDKKEATKGMFIYHEKLPIIN